MGLSGRNYAEDHAGLGQGSQEVVRGRVTNSLQVVPSYHCMPPVSDLNIFLDSLYLFIVYIPF